MVCCPPRVKERLTLAAKNSGPFIPASRLDRLAFGHVGDAEPIGKGVSELRIHHGPGYRVYFQRRGDTIIVLLCGGNKGSQARDIKSALRLADEWKE